MEKRLASSTGVLRCKHAVHDVSTGTMSAFPSIQAHKPLNACDPKPVTVSTFAPAGKVQSSREKWEAASAAQAVRQSEGAMRSGLTYPSIRLKAKSLLTLFTRIHMHPTIHPNRVY